MARADTVALTYTAEISDLKKKLAEIPGATAKEAKAAVAQVSQAVKLVAKAEAEAKKSAQGSAAGLKSLGDAAGKTNESFAAMGSALSTVSPELGGLVSRIGAVANGLKGASNASALMGGSVTAMAGTLGVAGLAAGVAFVAYQTMSREMEQAAATTKLLRELSDSLTPSIRQLESAELALAVATGATTAAQAAQITTQRAARDAVLDFAKAQRQQRDELNASIESATRWKEAIDGATFGPLGALAAGATDFIFGFSDSIEDASGKLGMMDAAVQKQAATQKQIRNAVIETTAATDANKRASAKSAEAVARETTTRGQLLAMVRGESTARAQLADMMGEISARQGGTEAEAAINAQFEKRIALLDQIAQQTGYNAEVEAAFQAAQIDRELQLQALKLGNEAALAAASLRAHQDEMARLEAEKRARQRLLQENLSAFAQFSGGVADLAAFAAEQQSDSNRKAAKRSFAIAKAAGIAEAAINGAIAITRALAELGPIAGAFATAGIAATTAAQVAVIASQKPSFNDTPGVVQLRGGGAAQFAPGDMVVAGKDLDDMRRQIEVAAGDRSSAPQVQVVAIPSYQGRTYELARRDAYRRPGADFAAMNRARPMGSGGW